jgi:hypothetical protein
MLLRKNPSPPILTYKLLLDFHSTTVKVYEIVDGSDLTFHYGESPSYKTVSEAAPHVGATNYLVAVENGWMRQLTPEEEVEFQKSRWA